MSSKAERQTHSRLSFIPYTTFIDPVFWNEVNRLKVNDWKLDESPKPVHANFSIHGAQLSDSILCFDKSSLDPMANCANANDDQLPLVEAKEGSSDSLGLGSCRMNGTFHLVNTKKAFLEDIDRKQLLDQFAQKLWTSITSMEWLDNPDLLNFFYLTAYADVKNFTYFFWNCIPALVFPDNIRQVDFAPVNSHLHSLAIKYFTKNEHKPFIIILDGEIATKLSELSSAAINSADQLLLVFANPSSVQSKMGWTLRNLLAAIAHLRPNWSKLRVLALTRLQEFSFISTIEWDLPQEDMLKKAPKCAGWERTSTDKLTFRSVDLKFMFDPIRIMEQSVDLNLKLIRWRQAPSIDLDKFTSLRVLLVGSGTLGCNISRSLLGWGIRHFTFLDYATVSYNNPIRQSLFCFDDCVGGPEKGAMSKAQAAANALKRIYPLAHTKGIQMKVPMPGHPYGEQEESSVRQDCQKLEDYIRECDVLFLVMDSREARWLCTLLAAVYNKLAITVALGFDDFMIIRHGANPPLTNAPICEENMTTAAACCSAIGEINLSTEITGAQLGCYFCNDVTAPGNSTSERALDQQCTISRSGISMIASGFATELLASLLQHELGAEAPARLAEVDENSSLLGGTPHQIRGFLSRFHQMTPTVRRFEQCTACGKTVRQLYSDQGFTFLDRVFKDPKELERLTGLDELQRQANEFQADVIELDETDSL